MDELRLFLWLIFVVGLIPLKWCPIAKFTIVVVNQSGFRRVPAQDVLFALILLYVAKTIYLS